VPGAACQGLQFIFARPRRHRAEFLHVAHATEQSNPALLLHRGLPADAGSAAVGLAGTELAKAQCNTVHLKLLKIGAQIRITVRKIWVSLSTGYPYLELFRQVHRQLQVAALRC
jgi:hypothetical protein